ncbi:MAG: hypothetical protein ACTSSK_01860, partial [Candidatus Heimdallarchaeota archaeon]
MTKSGSTSDLKEKPKLKIKLDKKVHQIIILSILHIVYILIEAFNLFEVKWVSGLLYGVLCVGTIAILWLQKENINYLLPIPFISLIIVGGILEETITITAIFV